MTRGPGGEGGAAGGAPAAGGAAGGWAKVEVESYPAARLASSLPLPPLSTPMEVISELVWRSSSAGAMPKRTHDNQSSSQVVVRCTHGRKQARVPNLESIGSERLQAGSAGRSARPMSTGSL